MSLARSVLVPPDAASVGVVRHALTEVLGAGGADQDTIDTATLLASEVVTNAVLHAATDITVTIRVGPGVLVLVEDGSPDLPRLRPHAPDSLGGRGLDLVEALAAAYGVEVRPEGGKSVWFTLGGAPVPSAPGWVEQRPELRRVGVLRRLPVGLYRVLHEYNEAVFRDYELSRPDPADAPSRALFAAAVRARTAFAERTLAALAGLPDSAHHDTPILAGPGDEQGFRAVLDAFAAAESALSAGAPLTRAPVPELLALRTWIVGEIIRQSAGEPARPWAMPASARPGGPRHRAGAAPAGAAAEPAPVPAAVTAAVGTAAGAVVAADGANRIVALSPAAAALLGWEAGDLVGRRLTTIVPDDLVEAHLAGFSRHRLTGRSRIIGRTVELPALRRDGTTVPVRLRLETRTERSGTWYLGWMQESTQPGR